MKQKVTELQGEIDNLPSEWNITKYREEATSKRVGRAETWSELNGLARLSTEGRKLRALGRERNRPPPHTHQRARKEKENPH